LESSKADHLVDAGVSILSSTCTERQNTRPKVARVGRSIDTREGKHCKATLKDNMALSLLSLKYAIVAALHDVLQHLFNLRETK